MLVATVLCSIFRSGTNLWVKIGCLLPTAEVPSTIQDISNEVTMIEQGRGVAVSVV
jgi:hypothetical protein